MPTTIDIELLERIKDRYEPMELLELLDITIDEVLDAWEDKVIKAYDAGCLDC